MQYYLKFKSFHSRKCLCKHCLQNGSHFVNEKTGSTSTQIMACHWFSDKAITWTNSDLFQWNRHQNKTNSSFTKMYKKLRTCHVKMFSILFRPQWVNVIIWHCPSILWAKCIHHLHMVQDISCITEDSNIQYIFDIYYDQKRELWEQ